MTDLKQKEEIITLTRKYLAGEASPKEIAFLDKYYQHFEMEPGITDEFSTGDKAMLEKEL